MNEERLHDVELDLARCIERLDHNHECLEALKGKVDELTSAITSLRETVLVKFSEQRGREIQARRIAIVISTIVSLVITGAGVALAALAL